MVLACICNVSQYCLDCAHEAHVVTLHHITTKSLFRACAWHDSIMSMQARS